MYLNQKDFDRWGRFYFDNEGAGSGGDTNANAGGLSEDALKAFNNRLGKMEGNATGMAMVLFNENYQLREKLRIAEGKVSPDGAVILTGDDAQAWQAYKALGTHEEVKTAVEQRTQLQGQLDTLQREAVLRDAASAAGFKFSVLQDRDKVARIDGKELSYAVREVEEDGKKRQIAFVKDGDQEKPLSDYAKEQWAEFMPALVAQGSTAQSSGTPFPAQHSGTGGNAKPPDLVSQVLQEMNDKAKAVKNPLLKS